MSTIAAKGLRAAAAAATAVLAFAFSAPAQAVSGGGFSLSVRGEAEGIDGYVRMRHNQTYAICFSNDRARRADAVVSVDGVQVGVWRLNPNQRACVERPQSDAGRFTFYRSESWAGQQSGAWSTPSSDRGVISAVFYPEKRRRPVRPMWRQAQPQYDMAPAPQASRDMESGSMAPVTRAAPRSGLESGVTGLSGQSGQTFGTAGEIERDYAAAVTLQLRLVFDPAEQRQPYWGPRPLPGRYDRYAPPPVGR